MTLNEFKKIGGCEGCQFFGIIDFDSKSCIKGCCFPWFDDAAVEWNFEKNCDDLPD